MATKKVSALTAAPLPLAGTELLVLGVTDVQSYKITYNDFLAEIIADRPTPTEFAGPIAPTTRILKDGDEYIEYSDLESAVTASIVFPSYGLNDLTDVVITTPTTGQLLSYNGTNWINSAAPTSVTTLDDLTDVVITTPVVDNTLVYNGTNWVNQAAIPPASTLNDLTDVTITTPSTGNSLKYDGTIWYNEKNDPLKYAEVYAYNPFTSSGLTWGYSSGTGLWSGFTVTAGTLTLTDNATNYIVVLKSNGAISVSTTTANWDSDNYVRLYRVVTSAGSVTNLYGSDFDYRAGDKGLLGSANSGVGSVEGEPLVYVRVQQSSSQSFGASAITVIQFQNVVEDATSMWDTANNRLVIGPEAAGKVANFSIQTLDTADSVDALESWLEVSTNSGSTWVRVAQSDTAGIDHFGITAINCTRRVALNEWYRVIRFNVSAKTSSGNDRTSFTFSTIESRYLPPTRLINTQAGTTYTLTPATDADNIVEMTNSSGNVISIPNDSTSSFGVGSAISVVQIGSGATTVSAAAGVTLNGVSEGEATLVGQYASVSLYKRSANTWVIQGAHGGVT
jgi:hypothetical protein